MTTFDERETRALAGLLERDQQAREAKPDPAVSAALERPGLSLAESFATLVEGYADRPALGERARELITDPSSGRTSSRRLPSFDTITYRELGKRVEAVAAEWHGNGLREDDLVALLGIGSIDYTTALVACARLGVTAVPLQTSAAVAGLQKIIEETGPRLIVAGVELLTTAADLAADSVTVRRLVVLDHHPEIDDERERLDQVRARLTATGVELVTLDEIRRRGAKPAPRPTADPDRLWVLVYTSGSTGTPKGAMYTERIGRLVWGGFFPRPPDHPFITLSFTPLSHGLGLSLLFGALRFGGTAHFVATSDLSTLFEDIGIVRPTELLLVPRVCEMIRQHFEGELDRHPGPVEQLRAEVRDRFLGGRVVWSASGSAPLAAALQTFMEELLDLPMHDVFGSTEGGGFMVDHKLLRPPVTDYRLIDVPELGYFGTDSPHPRGEFLLKAESLVPGYFNRPDITAEVFDEEGFFHTGDIMAEIGPDELVYVDRAKNVLKLSQGEFVALSRLDSLFGTADLIRQVYVHGDGERSYLLAVIVPTDPAATRSQIAESIRRVAQEAGLNSYEIPRDFIVETAPFTVENGLLTGAGKLSRTQLGRHYGPQLAAMYDDAVERESGKLADLRRSGPTRPVVETVALAAQAITAAAVADPGSRFTDLGGDSLSALSFSQLLEEIFEVEVPVGVVISPANNLRTVAARISSALAPGARRPTVRSVHGGTDILRATDLALDKFFAWPGAQRPPSGQVRTVLLTGANGYLGRFLCLQWLERLAETGGTLVCLVRGTSSDAARDRLEQAFATDPALLARFRELGDHLVVLAGDVSDPDLGLDTVSWQRLADSVDVIVHAAALVNHVLSYEQLFGPNVVGTAELIRLALTGRLKPFTFLSSVVVPPPSALEDDDIRQVMPRRELDDRYASGYAASKWASEVLLREVHDATGLPVTVFRSDMIMAHPRYRGQLNLPDMFTRLLLSLIVTGIAPPSFYRNGIGHYDGLPVDFIAEAVTTLGSDGYDTYNVVNPHDDGVGLDVFVDWLVKAGHPIHRLDSYHTWVERITAALRALPERQRKQSLLPIMAAFAEPSEVGPGLPADRFRAAVRKAIGEDIPHLTVELVRKYAADLGELGLISAE